jgi:hypothetical protein
MSSKEDLIRAIQDQQDKQEKQRNEERQAAGRISSDVEAFYKMLGMWMSGIPFKCSRQPSNYRVVANDVHVPVEDFVIEVTQGARVIFSPRWTRNALSYKVTGLGNQWEEMNVVERGQQYELQDNNQGILSVFTDEVLYDKLKRLMLGA